MSIIGHSRIRRTGDTARSTEEWEQRVGDQLRRARLVAGLDQAELAASADVSIGALRNLERGSGSTLRTLVRVVRALGLDAWLDSLSPAVGVSPVDILRTGRSERTRVYRARGASGSADTGS